MADGSGGSGHDKAKPPVIDSLRRPPHGIGLHTLGGRRGFAVAIGLIVAFALGYLAALWSGAAIVALP
ncbi:hypothetical protein OHD62_11845 [Mesorhizobium sp. YC-39]|uniref:hypothetical protein n=1 Tax=unclassified Mesorhizobium TaxID=325217 RepID=UPI0021E73E10|nr:MULTISPECIES: hypothetical protein [unclassified Mesorhizobium]MCV3207338.1 hypothetical protein [Mesorhizobium sp. YC-2]MCV3229065.1 hypothetical protein [Mesorhizobium sp. YC-39]